jgi:hypothetical protein
MLSSGRGGFVLMLRRVLVLAALSSVMSSPTWALDDEVLNSLSYRLVGPFRGGRVTAVTGVIGDSRTYYMGTTGGGVWKTTDAGLSWRNVSDMVRRLEPAEQPEVMGEVDPMLAGHGLLQPPSTGWPERMTDVRQIRRDGDPFGAASIGAVAVAPSDANLVWAGTGSACIRGNVSPGDGVYRSTDAGATWRHM